MEKIDVQYEVKNWNKSAEWSAEGIDYVLVRVHGSEKWVRITIENGNLKLERVELSVVEGKRKIEVVDDYVHIQA